MPQAPLIACPDCDLLQREVALPPGDTASCARCGTPLYRSTRGGLQHALAFTLAAMCLFLAANTLPIASVDLGVHEADISLHEAIAAIYAHGETAVAALVAFTTVIAPALELFAMAYMLLPLALGVCPSHIAIAFRLAPRAGSWALVDVFMLAVGIALVKLDDVAPVSGGLALWPYAGLILLVTAVGVAFDPREIWLHAHRCRAAAAGVNPA